MKRRFEILVLLVFCCFFSLKATTYWASPDGKSSNAGSQVSPYDFATGVGKLSAGDILYLKGGQYNFSTKQGITKSGTAKDTIRIWAVEGDEPVVFDFRKQPYNSSNRGISMSGNYVHLKGITIRYAGDNGLYSEGSNNKIENCIFYGNCDTGLQLKNGTNNLILNCDSYNNFDYMSGGISDPDFGGNADGFADKQYQNTTGKNVYVGCRSWSNSDDGWDFYQKVGNTEIRNSICYANGPASYNMTNHPRYETDKTWFDQFPKTINGVTITLANYKNYGNANGFKLGGDNTQNNVLVYQCVSVGQLKKGFDQNNNAGAMTLYNNSGYNNGTNYGFSNSSNGSSLTIKNCLSLGGGSNSFKAGTLVTSNNSWNTSGVTCTVNDFLSLDVTLLLAARQANGDLAVNDFLRLKPTSNMIDKGVIIPGYPYKGKAPDMGAYEYDVYAGQEQLPQTSLSYSWIGDCIQINSSSEIKQMTLFSLSGVPLISGIGNQLQVPISPIGIYVLRIEDSQGKTFTLKITPQR